MIRRLLLGGAAAVIIAGATHAAEIRLEGKNADGVSVVSITGNFIEQDIERFADVTKDLEQAIISFSSNGGSLLAGIEIGTRIRLRGYKTVVADQKMCYSACALAWLGGATRYVDNSAKIGFHAAYMELDGRFQETGMGNAVIGGYAANLGLRTSAIMFLTSAPPDDFNYLTYDISQTVGIRSEFIDTRILIMTPYTQKDQIAPRIQEDKTEIFSAEAQLLRGLEYEKRGEYVEARRWYLKAVEQGNVEANTWLGGLFEYGRGVPQNQAVANYWYRKAAEQGHSVAQARLGSAYYYLGARDEGVKWSRKAALQGGPGSDLARENLRRWGY